MEANNNGQDPVAANASAAPVAAAASSVDRKPEIKPESDGGNEFSAGNTLQVESQAPPVPSKSEAPAAPPNENEFAAHVVASVEVKEVPKVAEVIGEEADTKTPAEVSAPKEEAVDTEN